MRLIFKFVSVLAIPIALIGALMVALALSSLYMVTYENVQPGEPIWLDELAPSVEEGLVRLAIGVCLIGLALSVRFFIRRKLTSDRGQTRA